MPVLQSTITTTLANVIHSRGLLPFESTATNHCGVPEPTLPSVTTPV